MDVLHIEATETLSIEKILQSINIELRNKLRKRVHSDLVDKKHKINWLIVPRLYLDLAWRGRKKERARERELFTQLKSDLLIGTTMYTGWLDLSFVLHLEKNKSNGNV